MKKFKVISPLLCLISTLLEARDPPIEINKIMKDIPPSECQRIFYDTFPMVEVRGKKIMEALYLRWVPST